MKFNVEILNEAGYEEAMVGLSLSYNQPIYKMKAVADRLYNKNNGHNKFLESINVWIDINAPRYWWSEFDTYRIGVTKQSESTMHTIFKKNLTQGNFVKEIRSHQLFYLNDCINRYNQFKIEGNKKEMEREFINIKSSLPEGFLQRRIVCTNYKVLRHIIEQRKNHRLAEWIAFCNFLEKNCKYREYLN